MGDHYLRYQVEAVNWAEDEEGNEDTINPEYRVCIIPKYYFTKDDSYYTKETEFYLHHNIDAYVKEFYLDKQEALQAGYAWMKSSRIDKRYWPKECL